MKLEFIGEVCRKEDEDDFRFQDRVDAVHESDEKTLYIVYYSTSPINWRCATEANLLGGVCDCCQATAHYSKAIKIKIYEVID